MKTRLLLAALVAAVALSSGCAAFLPNAKYVEADRATYDAVAPFVLNSIDEDPTNDPTLDAEEKNGLRLVLKTWDLRLRAAESEER